MNLAPQFEDFLLIIFSDELFQCHVHKVLFGAEAGNQEPTGNKPLVKIDICSHIHTQTEKRCKRKYYLPNASSSAIRRTGANDCNRDAPAGFAAAHG